jgi:hypothetical protein
MRRLFVSVLAIALAAGGESAAAEEPIGAGAKTEVGVHLQFRAGGFQVELENNADDDDDEITLAVRGRRQFVYYNLEGDVNRKGVEAGFGNLGEVSLTFEPTKTLSTRGPPRRCRGEDVEELEGVFSGTFRFRGERGYVEAETERVHGGMQVHPQWKCEPRRAALSSRPPARPAAAGQADVAVISARRDHEAYFAAVGRRAEGEQSSTTFVATTLESREAMLIYRYAVARARASTFLFDLGRGIASVRPPWPFQGSAVFRRGPHGHNSWTGSLRVPMLGAGVLRLTGAGVRATIADEYNDE